MESREDVRGSLLVGTEHVGSGGAAAGSGMPGMPDLRGRASLGRSSTVLFVALVYVDIGLFTLVHLTIANHLHS